MTITQPVFATMLLLALIALGEVISIITRARVPMLLVTLIGFLVLIWTGIFPKNIVETSSFNQIGMLLVTPLVVHLGTLIPLKQMLQQYKAVLIALTGTLFAVVLVLPVITFIFGYETAVSGVGPLVGGIVAFIITSTELKEAGFSYLVVIPALVLSLHKLFGMPAATFFLRKYALILRDQMDQNRETAASLEAVLPDEKPVVLEKSPVKKYQFNTANILLFKLFVGGALAIVLEQVTGLHNTVWCLIIGVLGRSIKIYDESMMDKAKASSVAMLGAIFIVIASMSEVKFSQFIHFIPQILLIIVIGLIGILLGSYLCSKLLKWHPYQGMSLALTAMFGFPADYILCQEVSRSIGRTEEEQQLLLEKLSPPMLIGGFTTVTIASVVIASFLVKTL
ncbi:hypothetical protein P4629_17985 [Priestia aryabhattai]|uniref:hypothetical protein n=1 Tax=Priestia TaxID=2800373 RepID=UPI0028780AFA|nr:MULTISPECIES: hypothetical protein [Priestia]MED4007321.1 hypothetical protein [Priestia aryabhattai]